MEKRILIGMLCAAFLYCGMSAYGAETKPEIVALTGKVSSKNFDGDLVSQALDEYVAPLIGAHVRLEFYEQEKCDLVFSQYASVGNLPDVTLLWSADISQTLCDNGRLLPLDNLLVEYGKDILSSCDDDILLNIHQFNDSIYAIPNQSDRAISLCVEYRVEIAEKYNLDMSKVKCLEDLTEIFQQLSEQNGEIIPISNVDYITWDPLTDSLGVLTDFGQNTTVTNLYETQEYENLCYLVNEWRHKGYLQNTASSVTAVNSFSRSPEIFCRVRRYSPSLPYVDSADAGEELACVILTEPYTYTDLLRRGSWGISAQTEYPEAAMKFLNLMYSDPKVMNLLTYGIEGVHYQVIDQEKGVIDFPKGVTVYNSGYAQFRGYFYGNEFLTYVWKGYPTDIWEQVQQFNYTALRSKAYGFIYDPSAVLAEVNRCTDIINTYHNMLMAGVGNVHEILAIMRQELKTAGIERVIQEKQKQLNEWIAAGGSIQ